MNIYCVLDAENTKLNKSIILEKNFWVVQNWDIRPAFNGDLK